jgi:hypothetical protein
MPNRAAEHLSRARELALRGSDPALLSEVAEAEARLAFARGDDAMARERSDAALSAIGEGGSQAAAAGAYITLARVAHRSGDHGETERRFEQAAGLLRERRSRAQLRELLAEWADVRSAWGDPEGANALYSEALGRTAGGRRASARSPEPAGSRRRQPPS